MADKKPIALYSGVPGELKAGDVLPASILDATPKIITGVAADNFSPGLRLNALGEIVKGLGSKGNRMMYTSAPAGWKRGLTGSASCSVGYTVGNGPYLAMNVAASNDTGYLGDDTYFAVGDTQTVDWVVGVSTAATSGENHTASIGFLVQQSSGNTGTGNYAAYWQVNFSGVNVICKNGSGVTHTVAITLTGFDFTVPSTFRVIMKPTQVEFWWNGTLQFTETSSTYLITDTSQKLCQAINFQKTAGSGTRTLGIYNHHWS